MLVHVTSANEYLIGVQFVLFLSSQHAKPKPASTFSFQPTSCKSANYIAYIFEAEKKSRKNAHKEKKVTEGNLTLSLPEAFEKFKFFENG